MVFNPFIELKTFPWDVAIWYIVVDILEEAP